MANDTEFSSDDLRQWQRDPKGKAFWDAIQDRFSAGVSGMRLEVRKGNLNESIYHAAQVDAAEEILQLVDALIEEKVQDVKDQEAKT